MGVGEVKNCQNQAYVINEWAPIEVLSYLNLCALRIRSCVPKTYGQGADEKLALRLTIYREYIIILKRKHPDEPGLESGIFKS